MTPEEVNNLAWNHIKQGRYDEAIAIYERILQPGQGKWGNYGIALLMRGDAVAAEQAFLQIRLMPNFRRIVILDVGVALWCQGKREAACADWQQEMVRVKTTEVRYYNASGLYLASLLWWASLQMEEPDLTEAALSDLRLLRTWEEQAEEWGMVMAACILGEITPEEFLLEAAGTPDLDAQPLGVRHSRHVTQSFFYLSGRYPPHSAGWCADLNSAIQYGTPHGITEPEYHLARYELGH